MATKNMINLAKVFQVAGLCFGSLLYGKLMHPRQTISENISSQSIILKYNSKKAYVKYAKHTHLPIYFSKGIPYT